MGDAVLLLAASFGLVPTVVWGAGLAVLVVDVVALASVWRARAHSAEAKLVWTVVVALLPVFGAAAWFVLGRERRRARPAGA